MSGWPGPAEPGGGTMKQVSLDVTDAIATITLRRPEARNAFTDVMEAELVEAFERCDADDAVRVVVLTGAGSAFCVGMDLSDGAATFDNWRDSPDAPAGTQHAVDAGLPIRRDGGGRVTLRMFDMRKPVIAAINGHAVGVGITMTLAADIRVASDDAKIGFVFARRGLVPESCSSWFLPRLVGIQTALEWVLTGRVFGAGEALARGLVHSTHAREDVLAVALGIAREIADNTAPVSVALARQMLWRELGADHPMSAHRIESDALNTRGVSADAAEGITAFLEKRPARFPDSVSADLPDVFAELPHPVYTPPKELRAAKAKWWASDTRNPDRLS
jgi:enoyl-CoA hydratase/carnithine racemase